MFQYRQKMLTLTKKTTPTLIKRPKLRQHDLISQVQAKQHLSETWWPHVNQEKLQTNKEDGLDQNGETTFWQHELWSSSGQIIHGGAI